MTVSLQDSILSHHNRQFDFARDRAEEFVRNDLELPHARALGRLAVVHENDTSELKDYLGDLWGGYNALTEEAIITAHPDIYHPKEASQRLVSEAVHELVHSATASLSTIQDEHLFWREGMAGLGEALYLSELERQGKRAKVADFVMRGMDLVIPGTFRYYEDNATDGSMNTSTGLVAATSFAVAQKASGETARNVLKMSQYGDAYAYAKMKGTYDRLSPGLYREVEQYPETDRGILEATAMVHDEAKRRGVIPRR
jgi:hypothetical protein